MHPVSHTMQRKKVASLRCGCCEGELIHRFGSKSPPIENEAPRYLPSAKFVIYRAQSFRGSCFSDRFAYATFFRCVREKEGQPVVVRELYAGWQKEHEERLPPFRALKGIGAEIR